MLSSDLSNHETCHTSIEPSITQIFAKTYCVYEIGRAVHVYEFEISANILCIFLVCAKHNNNTECIFSKRRQNNSRMYIVQWYMIEEKPGE